MRTPARERSTRRAGTPLWLGLLVLVVGPFVVLAAVISRGPTLGVPAGAMVLHSGQEYVSGGQMLVLYVPTENAWRSCWLFDENHRALSPDPAPASLETVRDGVPYTPMLAYQAEPGATITVSCDVDPRVPLVLTPPITRQSALLPVAVGGVAGFAMIGFGTAMLLHRKRLIDDERRSARFG